MKYMFSGFSLNTDKKELIYANKPIYLTRKCYNLLTFLLQNSEKSLSKDQLVEHVWQGRAITDNTIDQCISKLRKALNDACPDEYIKSVYGQGISFLPKVTLLSTENTSAKHSYLLKLTTLLVFSIALLFIIYQSFSEKKAEIALVEAVNSAPLKISMIPMQVDLPGDTITKDQWFFDGGLFYLNNVLAKNKSIQSIKPKNEWFKSDDKQVLAIDILKQKKTDVVLLSDFGYNGEFYTANTTLRNHNGILDQRTFQSTKIQQLMSQVSNWTLDKVGIKDETVDSLLKKQDLSTDEYALESYIRSMSAQNKGDSKKAIVFLETTVEQDPDFLLAWYELAIAHRKQGDYKKSLAILNSLQNTSQNLAYKVAMVKGHTYDQMKQYEKAKLAYSESYSIAKNLPGSDKKIAAIVVSQAITYANTKEYKLCRQALDEAFALTNKDTQAHFYGVIMNNYAKLEKAEKNYPQAIAYAKKGIKAFIRSTDKKDEMNAKTRLSSLLRYQAEYFQAEELAKESLAYAKQQNQLRGISSNHFKLGLIYHAIGQFNLSKHHWLEALEVNKTLDLPLERAAIFEYLIDLHLTFDDKDNAETFLQRLEELYEQNPIEGINNILNRSALKYAIAQQDTDKSMQLLTSYTGEIKGRMLMIYGDLALLKNNTVAAENHYRKRFKELEQTGDFLNLAKVMNRLNRLYLDTSNDKAAQNINQTAQYKPFAYPYLKYKAMLNFKQGKHILAISLMQELKLKANDYWQAQDQLYLEMLLAVKSMSENRNPAFSRYGSYSRTSS